MLISVTILHGVSVMMVYHHPQNQQAGISVMMVPPLTASAADTPQNINVSRNGLDTQRECSQYTEHNYCSEEYTILFPNTQQHERR